MRNTSSGKYASAFTKILCLITLCLIMRHSADSDFKTPKIYEQY